MERERVSKGNKGSEKVKNEEKSKRKIQIAFAAVVLALCSGIGGLMLGTENPFVGFAILIAGMLFFVTYVKKMKLEAPEKNDELIQFIRGKSACLTVEVTILVIGILFLAVTFLPLQISASYAVGFLFVFYMIVYFVSLSYYSRKYS
jgi:uncharacterized membrane protein